MDKIDYMLKCRALFLYDVTIINDAPIYLNGYLNELLLDFFRTYGPTHFELFRLVCSFTEPDEDGDFEVEEYEEWTPRLFEFLKPLCLTNNKYMTKLFDDIGHENVLKICELAELFYKYIDDITMEDKLIRIKQ